MPTPYTPNPKPHNLNPNSPYPPPFFLPQSLRPTSECPDDGQCTGVPRSKEAEPPEDPIVGLCLGPYGAPKGGSISYEQGSPVRCTLDGFVGGATGQSDRTGQPYPFPGDGWVRTSVSFLQEHVVCERNRYSSTARFPKVLLFCDHAGLVINDRLRVVVRSHEKRRWLFEEHRPKVIYHRVYFSIRR